MKSRYWVLSVIFVVLLIFSGFSLSKVAASDQEALFIRKLTVEKRESGTDKELNVLPFGTYSNSALTLKAYVSGSETDSDIDYVTVSYNGLLAPETMKNEGGGVFSYELSANGDIAEYDISVTAYDTLGRSSNTCPNIANAMTGDLANNRNVMIEKIKPSITFDFITDGEPGEDGLVWHDSIESMELIVQDNNSGICNVDFYVNGIDFSQDKNEVKLLKTAETANAEKRNTEEQSYVFDTTYITDTVGEPADGTYSIHIEVTDNAGNMSEYNTEYYIDNIAPQIDKIGFSPSAVDESADTEEFVEQLEYGLYFNTDFTATVYVSDEMPSQGLGELQYRFVPYENGVAQEEVAGVEKIVDGKADLTISVDFKGQIFFEAIDNSGNRSGEMTTKAYIVDKTAPDIDISNTVTTPYKDAAGNHLYAVDNKIIVEITDTASGIREIGYAQSSEQNSFDRISITLDGDNYDVGDELEGGWVVASVDMNLVTKVTKTFSYNSDDNDIILTLDATDNALNTKENVKSEKFTIDRTSPIINVSFRADEGIDYYYNQDRIADITVIDRNFDEKLISVLIENTFGEVPSYSFQEQSSTEHVAVINFGEGDYTFDVTGTDLAHHTATVNFSGGNEKLFYVDKTTPVIQNNFDLLINESTENSFNYDKTIEIQVTEHNFDPTLTQLRITRKDAGESHNTSGLIDLTYEVLGGASWDSTGDVHTISFTLSKDAIYQVELSPVDLAGNSAERETSVVFEIDKTAPVVWAKNEMPVSADNTESVDIYTYLRENDPIPTVEFWDLNIDHIDYVLTVYIPDYTSSEADTIIRPRKVYLEDDPDESGTIAGTKFVLPDFVEDGVYALELVAVDVAGNESLLNLNTYARMINQDVLAYIMESNLSQRTGLYSFQYENGDAISKKPDDFEDIKICVLAREDTRVDVVLRDTNGGEINTDAPVAIDDNVYGVDVYNFTLTGDYFKENFQDDTDLQLILTVKNGDDRIDLGKMHIDNMAPTCNMPREFKSWHWYYGETAQTVTISNISELIDQSRCKVYDNGQEALFEYSEEDNTICFTLEKGWHNVGIVLCDMAGNTYYIQEKANIHIGFFWLWVIAATSLAFTISIICVIMYNIAKKHAAETNE